VIAAQLSVDRMVDTAVRDLFAGYVERSGIATEEVSHE